MKIFKKKPQQSSVKKTIFAKKEEKTPLPVKKVSFSNPKKLKSAVRDMNTGNNTPARVFKHKKCQCMFHFENGKRCTAYAAGNSTLCTLHGGTQRTGIEPVAYNDLSPSVIKMTKFDPSFHPIRYLELSKQGFSDVEIAAEFQVSISTLKDWSASIKEFSIAYDIGKTMYEAYFLRTGTRNLHNDRFNNSLFKYLTMNKLGYSDKIETKSMNTSLHGVLLVPGEMSMADWEANNIAMDAAKDAPVQ